MSLWERGWKPPKSRAPLEGGTVSSATDGERVLTHFCTLAYDGSSYLWPGFAGTVDAALEVRDKVQRYLRGEKNVW